MSPTTTVRVPAATVARLRSLAAERQIPIGEVVADLVRRFDEERFWQEVNAGYARLRADPTASDVFDAEVAAWDDTLLDGPEDGAVGRVTARPTLAPGQGQVWLAHADSTNGAIGHE